MGKVGKAERTYRFPIPMEPGLLRSALPVESYTWEERIEWVVPVLKPGRYIVTVTWEPPAEEAKG